MAPFSADGTSQTENLVDGCSSRDYAGERAPRRKISRLHASLVETIAWGEQNRMAEGRRVALSRVISACLVITTTASCLLLNRGGLVDLALGRIVVAVVASVWFWSTFTKEFRRDTRRACDGLSLLCFVCWSLAHIVWRATSSETAGSGNGSSTGGGSDAAPAWVWVDVGIAWAIAPVAGGSLQLSFWGSIVPSWLCVTVALAYGLRAEEVSLDESGAGAIWGLLAALMVFGMSVLAIGYQVLWEHARDAGALMAFEDGKAENDHRHRQARFSELLLRHLVTEPALKVLGAGVHEFFLDSRIFVTHSDALEQIQDGLAMLTDYGEKALSRLRSGAPELPGPVLEDADMEEILGACLRTTAYLAVSRDHHKVRLDMRVSPDVHKNVRTFSLWLSQMTRACLIHALHPEEEENVILRVCYARPGILRVGVEAVWRADGPNNTARTEDDEGPRLLSGWDRDMPAAAWWVRAAAMALGGEADYSRSSDNPGFNELWFTIPAKNSNDEEEDEPILTDFERGSTGLGTTDNDTTSSPQLSSARRPRGATNDPSTSRTSDLEAGERDGAPALPRPGRGVSPTSGRLRKSNATTLEPLANSPEVPLKPPHTMVTAFDNSDLGSSRADGVATGGGKSGRRQDAALAGNLEEGGSLPDEIRVSRVVDAKGSAVESGANDRRPSSAPSPGPTNGTAGFGGMGGRGGGGRSSTASLAQSVRNLIKTPDGLENLRRSVEGGDAEAIAALAKARSELTGKGRSKDGGGRSSSPSSSIHKTASVFGGLVNNLVESNSMNWLARSTSSMRVPEDRGQSSGDENSVAAPPKLKVLLVDPQGLVRWVLPRLKEKGKCFSVVVAHSAEEGMSMIASDSFGVVVVDLHMPRMSGLEFCRAVREMDVAGDGRVGVISIDGSDGGEGATVVSADRAKLLLHTTAAGSVKSDELQEFLEEGLADKYVPQPLDTPTLLDFLKFVGEDDDDDGARKMSVLLCAENSRITARADGTSSRSPAQLMVRALTNKVFSNSTEAEGLAGRGWFGGWKPPPPCATDMASIFFSVEGKDATGILGRKRRRSNSSGATPIASRGGVGTASTKTAGPWRPGPAAPSPMFGEDEGWGRGE